jgi:hypothetical protein
MNIQQQGYDGLVGLGPNSGSVIEQIINAHTADNMLTRIFQQNSTSQNYITFMLNRLGDSADNVTGQLTIQEVVPGYENITTQTKLNVDKLPGLTSSDQHWQFLTDKDGVIGPDGQVIVTDSIVPKAPKGQLVAVLDSGFTLPQVPRAMSDMIYGRVQGAEWSAQNEAWLIPCGQLLNLTFSIGGVQFPVHPLDVSSDDFNLTDSSGNTMCLGTVSVWSCTLRWSCADRSCSSNPSRPRSACSVNTT